MREERRGMTASFLKDTWVNPWMLHPNYARFLFWTQSISRIVNEPHPCRPPPPNGYYDLTPVLPEIILLELANIALILVVKRQPVKRNCHCPVKALVTIIQWIRRQLSRKK